MPTYKDLERLADHYLADQKALAKAHENWSKLPVPEGTASVNDPAEWATIKDDAPQGRLYFYQERLAALRTHGVYDGPTTLSYHHRTA